MPYDRYEGGGSRYKRGVWSHWVPLVVTVTVATAGLAAWAWSQRKDEHGAQEKIEEPEPDLDYENADYGDNPPYGASDDRPKPPQPPPAGTDNHAAAAPLGSQQEPDTSWGARMSGALRRTPSPQHFFDSTGRTVAAGMAAAGAAMGKALSSIREEDKPYGDRNPWSEEADAKKDRASVSTNDKRKTVAVVVSADADMSTVVNEGFHEHASMLSHIPQKNDFSKIKLFILIYAPGLKDAAMDASTSNLPPPSLSSSFSNVGHDQAQPLGDESKNPAAGSSTADPSFNVVYSQALTLVDKETMILPFTTPNGYAYILRHLQPEVIYLQESLAGADGNTITNMQTWLRHDVVLVVGAENGSGGLADSESEAEKPAESRNWWQRPERVGRGRGVIVVDSVRLHDDWSRRVQGLE